MRRTSWIVGSVCVLLVVANVWADDKSGLDGDGFLQKWLMLAPIPLAENESGADAVGKEQIKDEAVLKPKANDKVKVGDKEYTWKEQTIKDHLLDFNAILGNQTEDSVAYAVTYIVSPEEMKGIKMRTGSDDQCRVYLNGKEVFKYTEPRAADKDQDTTEVNLQKGVNVLVVKVVNEKVDFSFCVRFTDKDDKPITKLECKTAE